MKIHIFVFEDYGIATIQEGANEEETDKACKALAEKSIASYVLDISPIAYAKDQTPR